MREPEITSTQNDRVKRLAGLHRKKERNASGHYLVEGPHPVAEAAADGVLLEVLATPEAADDLGDLGVPVTVVTDHVLDRVADTRTPQGVVGVARKDPAALGDVVGRGFLVVCVDVADPGNVGTIIRAADAFGAAAVVLTPGSVDPWNPKAVRAATGSITHVPIVVDVPLTDVATACREVGQRLIGLDSHAAIDVADGDHLAPPVALVFGSEAHGLAPTERGLLDGVVALPRYGRAESLNLAAAVAVTSYVAARRTHGRP